MVIFKKIRFKNLLSYGNIFTEIEINKSPISAIQGATGEGKSVFLEAISVALFGKPFRTINKAGLLNIKNKSGLLTEIEFETNNKQYLVRRGIKPDIFEIYEDDELLNQSSYIRDYQSVLEKTIIKFDYSIFTQIVLVGHATYTSFMRLTSAQRRKFVESILGLDIFSVMNDLHKINCSDLKIKQLEIKAQITIIQEKIKILDQYIKKLESDALSNKLEQETKIKNACDDIDNQLNTVSIELVDKEQSIEELDTEVIKQLKDKLEKLNSLLNKSDIQYNRLNKDLEFYIDNPDSCPTCKQYIPDDYKNANIEQNKNKQKELDVAKIKIQEHITTTKNKLLEYSVILKQNKT